MLRFPLNTVHPYPSREYDLALMDCVIQNIWIWKDIYYNTKLGREGVDDSTYDLWWRNLLFLERKYPDDVRPNSPTIDPGAPVPNKKMSLSELVLQL